MVVERLKDNAAAAGYKDEIAALHAQANRDMEELCELRGQVAALEAEKANTIRPEGWRFTLAVALILIIMALATLGAGNLIFGLLSVAEHPPTFCSPLEERLFKARLKYHGLDKRFNSVWEENGQYYFKDDTGRKGKFI
jgi:hypothetical protein